MSHNTHQPEQSISVDASLASVPTSTSVSRSFSTSIVVPLLNEVMALPLFLAQFENTGTSFEQLIIIDGGSQDGSWQWLQEYQQAHRSKRNNSYQLIIKQSSGGRSGQMNAGAALATGELLLFLHADSYLPALFKDELKRAKKHEHSWGRFDIRFVEQNKFAVKVIAFFINRRSRLTGIATGDQAIFIQRNLFEKIQGFADIPLMEDIELCRRLKAQKLKPYCSKAKVLTSARRWLQAGVVKTVLLMWFLRLAYFLGVPAQRLAQFYKAVR